MFSEKKFSVEHALSMYATSCVQLPAAGIYDDDALASFGSITTTCHIYLIGLLPILNFIGGSQEGRTLILSMEVLGRTYDLKFPLAEGMNLVEKPSGEFVVTDGIQERFPDSTSIQRKLCALCPDFAFEILYIGQAYGQDGSRNAIDRLKKHETLQKISVQGVPPGYRLSLILLEMAPNRLVTAFNPAAVDQSQDSSRINAGLDKLFGTSEKERVSLYEASLIRHFKPPFNSQLKDSFPSTNMAILKDCYEKDFSAVVAEVCIDELPPLFSKTIPAGRYHIASHDLHKEDDRRIFFSTQD